MTDHKETASTMGTADLRKFALSNGQRASAWTRDKLENFYAETMGAQGSDQTSDQSEAMAQAATDMGNGDVQAALGALARALGQGGQSQGISEARVIELVREHSVGVQTVKVKRIDGTFSKPDIAHKSFQDILTVMQVGIPAYLVGPAGSGKTYVARQIADSLGLTFRYTGAISDRYMDYLGYTNPATGELVRTPFREAWEHGGVFLFDEFDGSFANEVLPLNAALAGEAEMAFPDGMVAMHEDFRLILAANTYGNGADRQYVGRFQLDKATLNRFAVIDFDYDESLESALSGNLEWCEYVQSVRHACAKLEIRHVISPRASINGAKLLAQGMARGKVADMVLWQGLSKAEQKRIKAEV